MRVTLVALNNMGISTLFIIRVYPTQLLFFNYNVIDRNKLEIKLKDLDSVIRKYYDNPISKANCCFLGRMYGRSCINLIFLFADFMSNMAVIEKNDF